MKTFELSAMNVLIVDDTSLMRVKHQKTLIEFGFRDQNLVIAEDGQVALTQLAALIKENRSVHLIICDWDMPRVTGLQFLQMLKSVPSTKTIPFLMITGHNEKEDILTALKAGASSYIIKPFKEEQFREKVIEVIGQSFIAST